MPLRATDAILHWRARDLSLTARTGQVGVFSRAGAAVTVDRGGNLFTQVTNAPRWMWYTDPVTGVVEPLLLTEGAKQNLILQTEQMNLWRTSVAGAGSAPVVTTNATLAPDNVLSADKVVFAAPAGGDTSIILSPNDVANTVASYNGSIYAKAFAAADVGKVLVYRHMGGSAYGTITLTASWQRVNRAETGFVGSTPFAVGLRPTEGSSTGTVSCYLWGAQLTLGTFVSSYVVNGGTALTRAADLFSFPFLVGPRAMTGYVDAVSFNDLDPTTDWHSLTIAGGSGPYFKMRLTGTNVYQNTLHYNNPTLGQSQGSVRVTYGQRIQHRGVLNGSTGTVISGMSVNGAAEVVAAESGAVPLALAWGAQTAYIGGSAAASAGFFGVRSILVMRDTCAMADLAEVA